MKKVKIYTAADCPQCDTAKNYLLSKTIDFEEVNLSKNNNAGKDLVKRTGYSMVPQIQIDNQFIVGFDRQKIDELLSEN